jgi:hypothetical protein
MQDRRFKSWLTAEGVRKLREERDSILGKRLPQLRCGDLEDVLSTERERHQLIRRVLYLNQLLNYNSNPLTRMLAY